jgi:hypothetical protein
MTEETEDIAVEDIKAEDIRVEDIADVKWLRPVVALECC